MNRFEPGLVPVLPAGHAYRLRFWGDFTVLDLAGNVATPRGRKARALLAWLALHPGRPISRERLCGLLWGDRAEEQARASLRQALFELKPFAAGPGACLQISRSHIVLNDATFVSDLAPPAEREPGEMFLADLDDIDEGFADWLRFERARQEAQSARAVLRDAVPHAAFGRAASIPSAPEAGRIDPRAFALYRDGLKIAGPPEARAESIALFEAALVLEPDFGACLAALAMAYAWVARWDKLDRPYELLATRAQTAATHALKIDPLSSYAQLALGILQPVGAHMAREALLDRAVAGAPGDAEVLRQRGEHAYNVGRTREAFGYFASARAADPDNLMVAQNHAMALADMGFLGESRALYAESRNRWPGIYWLLTDPWLFAANIGDWRYADSLASVANASPDPDLASAKFIISGLRDRNPASIEAVCRVAERELRDNGCVNLSILVLACNMGLSEESFAWLDKSSYAHVFEPDGRGSDVTGFYQGIIFGPANQIMRRDQRFVKVCAKIGLSRYWMESSLWPDCADELQMAYGFRDLVARNHHPDRRLPDTARRPPPSLLPLRPEGLERDAESPPELTN